MAGQLLLTTQAVKQVAFALAFRNESQFCRDFRVDFRLYPDRVGGAEAALRRRGETFSTQ